MQSLKTLLSLKNPDQFVEQLQRLCLSRPSASTASTAAQKLNRKRWRRNLRRAATKAWRRRHRETLPAATQARAVPADRSLPEHTDIVVLPNRRPGVAAVMAAADEPDAAAPRVPTAKLLRKHRQRFLHQALVDHPDVARGVIGRTMQAGEGAPVGPTATGRVGAAVRTLSASLRPLDDIGVVLAYGLNDAARTALTAAGAIVVPNTRVHLIDAAEGAGGRDATGAGHGRWHLENLPALPADHAANAARYGLGFLDTGIDAKHPEFAGRNVRFRKVEVDGRVVECRARDWATHGTHVAAIAAGNRCGVVPGAQIAMAAVLTQRDRDGLQWGYLAQVLAGLNWLVREAFQGLGIAPVINASLAGHDEDAGWLAPLQEAQDLGILIVAAVGNDAELSAGRPGRPGSFDSVLAVGATDRNDQVAGFSNWRAAGDGVVAKPDLCAPGVAIRSARAGGGYAIMSGSSMAAPFVAAMAVRHMCADPQLRGNIAALRARLVHGARPAIPAQRAGAGRIGWT